MSISPPLHDPHFWAGDPYPAFAELRASDPVHRYEGEAGALWLITRHADGLIVTCHAGSTHSEDVQRAIEAAGPVEVRGIILNRTRRWVPRWVSKLAGISRTSLTD